MKDTLGDRMKRYEGASRHYLPNRLPVIIRLDGKAFHTWTKGLARPYAKDLMAVMNDVAKHLCDQVQNTVLAYTQSDEISLLLVNYKDIDTSPWFDNNLQKMVSVAAATASAKMTTLSPRLFPGPVVKEAVFDARAFVLPEHEVNNYFIWRQQDWNRNSLAMLAQSLYSPKELHGKSRAEQHEMCFQKGFNWAALDSHTKDGRVVVKRKVRKELAARAEITVNGQFLSKIEGPVYIERSEWYVPNVTPIFKEDRSFVENLIKVP